MKKQRISWIDTTKTLAIIAVLVDHTSGVLYDTPILQILSYYSVSTFVLLIGVTSYNSLSERNGIKYILNRSQSILPHYIIASLLYFVLENKGFYLRHFLYNLCLFNSSDPLYFVCLYLQIVIICPLLYQFLVLCKNVVYEIIAILPLLVFSHFSIYSTDILGIYGGGGKLFGGTYVILLYLGLMIAKHYEQIEKLQKNWLHLLLSICILLSSSLWICYNKLEIDTRLPFGRGLNPPGISIILYAISVQSFIFWGDRMILNEGVYGRKVCFYIGKNSLFIFLYHRLFIDYFFPYVVKRFIEIEILAVKWLVYYSIMILGSITIGNISVLLLDCLRVVYLKRIAERSVE